MQTIELEGDNHRVYVYSLQDVIGKGILATVIKGHFKNDPERVVAIRRIFMRNGRDIFDREIETIKVLEKYNSQYIIKVHDIIFLSEHVYFVMDHCECSLNDWLGSRKKIDFNDGSKIIEGIIKSMKVLYQSNIVHCGLMPGIILLSRKNDPSSVKLTGFHLSEYLGDEKPDEKRLRGQKGAYGYMAPEVYLRDFYGRKSDIYSMGVLFYQILTAKLPFRGGVIERIRKKTEKITFPEQEGTCVVIPEIKDLIQRMLCYDEKERIGFEEIFTHPTVLKYFCFDLSGEQSHLSDLLERTNFLLHSPEFRKEQVMQIRILKKRREDSFSGEKEPEIRVVSLLTFRFLMY